MSIRTRVAVVLGTLSILSFSGVTSGTASADILSVRDDAGDVWRWVPTSYSPTDQPAGTQADVDVTRTTVGNLRRQVRIRVHYTDLTPIDGAWRYETLLRTDTDARYDVVLTASSADPAGTVSMWEENAGSSTCPSVRHSVDYEKDLLTVSVPRTCLGRPDSVQFVGMAGSSYWPTEGTEVDYNDDPQSTQARPDGLWSAPIHR